MKVVAKPKPVEGSEWSKGFLFLEKPEPRVERDEDVLIKVHAGAICGTDVGIYTCKESLRVEMLKARTDPVTVGHEFSGQIVDAGRKARTHLARLMLKRSKSSRGVARFTKRRSPGVLGRDRRFLQVLESDFFATAEMHVTCGVCAQCRVGERHVCRNTVIKGVHDDGAWAAFVKVPASNVRIFPQSEIPPDIISFMDALGNATHTVMSAPVEGRTVAILGCGVQGLMAVAIAKHAGARRIYVTDASHAGATHDKLVSGRFGLAKRFGADHCFDVARADERRALFETVRSETDNTGVDAAYEMSGNYNAYNDAARILRKGGVFSLLGIPAGILGVDFAKNIIFKGVTVHGIIGRRVFQTWDQMELLLKRGLARELVNNGFVTHRFPLNKYDEAMAVIENGDAYKVLLKP